MNPVRVGVIGIGNMGWHHARVLSLIKDAELVGVADPDQVRGTLATEQFGCRWFSSYEAMLPEVDAVCIAVPTLLHHRVGLACLEAGVDVLIEKPIAASQEEAADLIRAAEAAGRLLQVGHIERFNPAFRELVKVTANEEVVVLEARRHSPNADRANDVSVVLDLMIHDIDLVLELAGAQVGAWLRPAAAVRTARLITSMPPWALPMGWWQASRPARWPIARSAASVPIAAAAWSKLISSTERSTFIDAPMSRLAPTMASWSIAPTG